VEKLALLFSIRARGCAGIPVKSSTQRVLAAADWHRIGRELTAFAQALLNIHTWCTGNTVDVAGGREARDFVQEAIEKMSGFDADRGELVPYLKAIVRRSISNLSKSAENRHEISIRPRPAGQEGSNEDVGQFLDRRQEPQAAASPEEILSGPGERVTALFEAADGDDSLTELLDAAMQTGEATGKPLAQHLGTTPADINNRLRKLRRAAAKIALTTVPAKDRDVAKEPSERTTP
jgi:DNA-directed RNA polymerase specialized sigma24 family protein